MILAVLSAVVCFCAAVLIFTPYFRKLPVLRPLAVFLIFEGAWQLAAYLILQLDPTNGFILMLNNAGTILIIGFYIFFLFMTRMKSKRKYKKAEKERKG